MACALYQCYIVWIDMYALSGKTFALSLQQNTHPKHISTDSKFIMNYKYRDLDVKSLKFWSEYTKSLHNIIIMIWFPIYTHVHSACTISALIINRILISWLWSTQTHTLSTNKQCKIDLKTIQNVNQTSFIRLNT